MPAFSVVGLAEALRDTLPAAAEGGVCVALSGGLDSTVLLAASVQLQRSGPAAKLRAVHVNHQLNPDAARWEKACAQLAARLGVEYSSERIAVPLAAGEGLEAAARRVRYAALRRQLQPGEVLLTAHHADDQLETLLLALLRGAGTRGLASMPICVPFGAGWHARPLLRFSRAQLRLWAQEQGLEGVEDPMNVDLRFARSYLRGEVLPRLTARWPSAAFSATRSAAHLAEASELLDDLAAGDLEEATHRADVPGGSPPPSSPSEAQAGQGKGGRAQNEEDRGLACLSVAALRELSSARRRNLLRYWLRLQGLSAPTTAELAALEHDMLQAESDRIPCTRWADAEVRRYRNQLYAGPALPAARAGDRTSWDWRNQVLDLGPGLGRLHAISGAGGGGLARERLPPRLELHYRDGGERLRLPGQAHRKELKKLLQDEGVLPWWRARLPLLKAGERLVAVADLFITQEFAARPGEEAAQIVWEGRPQIIAQ